MYKHFTQSHEEGFTLVEILVSLSIFIVVMVFVMGSVLGVVDVNNKAQTEKTAMDNLNFAVESISRTVRFSTNFHCGSTGVVSQPQNCPAGDTSLTVQASNGTLVTYTLSGTTLMRSINGGTPVAMTSPEVTITSVTFRVFGALAYGTDYLQPQIILNISGRAGNTNKIKTLSSFQLETTLSQRKLDI